MARNEGAVDRVPCHLFCRAEVDRASFFFVNIQKERFYTVILQFFGTLNFGIERSRSVRFRLNFGVRGCCRDHSMFFFHLGVFLISV